MTEIDTALLVLRVWLGTVMLAHGVRHYRGRARTTKWLASMGFTGAPLQWIAMTTTEIGAGVLLVAGLLTSIGCAVVIAICLVAFAVVHRKAGFWVTARPDEGWEYVATLAAAALAVAALGPGRLSIDHAAGIADDLDGWTGIVIAAGGVVAAIGQLATSFRPGERDA
jgi:putative oxidoreductase